MFNDLRNTIREEVVLTLFHAQVELEQPQLEPDQGNGNLQYAHETAAGSDAIAAAGASGGAVATAFSPQAGGSSSTATAVNEHKDVGRNDPCWCGSGKKFKRCHGA